MTPLTPAQRKLRARAAAYAMHAQGGTNTKPAFDARMERLRQRVDPDGVLPEPERERRAQSLLRSQMTALSLKASKARARRRAPAA